MSSIAFHSPKGTIRIGGRERAMMNHHVHQLFLGAAELNDPYLGINEEHCFKSHLTDPSYFGTETGKQWVRSFALSAMVNGEKLHLSFGDKVINVWCLALNTALACGETMSLMARLHAQCEIHCWVDGPNRKWLAGVIERGLANGMLRSETQGYDGWAKVVTMLESDATAPVVTSYSVCDSFPNAETAGWKPTKINKDGEADWDEFDCKPAAERWELAMAGLRKDKGMELKPNYEFHFGETNLNAYQAIELAHSLRRAKEEKK